ncbi:MAG TPA: stage II sporulation protein M [Gemmatimonadaceae bacterium]|nr:stage II sporulation protein M [Gemmatimonadaceae bacterium]
MVAWKWTACSPWSRVDTGQRGRPSLSTYRFWGWRPRRDVDSAGTGVFLLTSLRSSLYQARFGILVAAITYAASVSLGLAMAHAGNRFALDYRDSLVARAERSDPAARADNAGAHAKAAVLDFSRNLGLAAIPETIGGLTLVIPVCLAAYRGWVGGIVSVDGAHRSRLRHLRSASYYLVTLFLQLSAFTLAAGAGLHLGWAFLRKRGPFVGPRWFRLPGPALADVAQIYLLIVPLFAVGSLWEFLSPIA